MIDGDNNSQISSRRTFLKAAGAAGVLGLAGCSGNDGGDGGDGSDGSDGGSGGSDGGDGSGGSDGGDGGSGGSTGGDLTEITFTNFPINLPGAIWEYLDNRTNILANEMESAGYTTNRKASFQGPSLFFSGQAQIATDLNSIEAARASINRDVDLRVLDRSMSTFLGLHTKAGSKYDPQETGGVQQSFEALMNDNARIGIFGWGVGDVPAYQIVASRMTDGVMSQDSNDYNVVTSDAAAIPKLIEQGDLAAGASSPTHGAGSRLKSGAVAPLIYPSDFFDQQDWGTPSLENAVTRASFLESDREACQALVRAYDQGTTWFAEKALDDIPGDDSYMEKLGVSDPAVAEYSIKWILGEDVKWQYETDTPKLYEDVSLTEDWVASNKQFLSTAEDINQVPSGWQDRVEFVMDL